MADVTNPKTCLGYLGMVNPPQFLEESDQGKGRGGKDTCSAPQLYNLSHDKTSVPINPNKLDQILGLNRSVRLNGNIGLWT